ncbi:MAG: hypothetical protein ACP5IO_02215 [Elusimicrobiales bacterium]
MKKLITAIVSFFVISFTLKGYVPEEERDVIWLYLENNLKKISLYLEVSFDGKVILKTKQNNKTVVKEGYVKKVYVKDFFRETKDSQLMNYSRKIDLSKMLFYQGDIIRISASISGEIRRVVAPLNYFSKTFVYAFNEIYKASLELPQTNNYVSFISAVPLEGEVYANFLKMVPGGYVLPVIETSELKKNSYIFKAVSNPWRLIGITSKKDESEIMDFASYKRLYGIKSAFYIGTTRGNFQLSIVE